MGRRGELGRERDAGNAGGRWGGPDRVLPQRRRGVVVKEPGNRWLGRVWDEVGLLGWIGPEEGHGAGRVEAARWAAGWATWPGRLGGLPPYFFINSILLIGLLFSFNPILQLSFRQIKYCKI